ncbi:CDP-diacylglycerol--glycerol-3-phosphate 3-phosphatidyltransferase [Breznakiella homolactica]|uniref:CDP-diacylglycerol--glycerol-3-phosphate 3-phosphatidyltransferase n=1 Tax=Breznakiella homolactica TaxID=2798577 RepID=A0A7T8BCX4_9SPIR|nr:CDP-diacylglycerol--glycerol-3-phosphate 3-phosphatidyltransferase [Breznakiella homolactica]QQO10683.1 CDP-diacylglycerol--glycerol-3-phosphate 3-phosphatidyltransferase [Breznakiella homolactica]
MTIADKITFSRLVMAPLFFIVYLLQVFFPRWDAAGAFWTIPVLWLLFIVSEITDLVDGKVARGRNEVTDFGKLFDPFADVLVRITYFLCFVVDGILPVLLFLLVLYREFGIQFLRTLMMKQGIAMGARWGGKIKAFTYMLSGGVALIASTVRRLGMDESLFSIFKYIAVGIFAVSVIISVVSFFDYVSVYRKAGKN